MYYAEKLHMMIFRKINLVLIEDYVMWYFAWILGTALACTFAILNALWFELRE